MRTLVIGYGNPSRRDDGVAFVIVNALRRRLGAQPLEGNQDGFDDLGQALDTLFLQQLMPELAETLALYDRVIFLDAHVGVFPETIRRVTLEANPDRAIVSHHVKPAGLIEIARRLYGRAPSAELISVRGFDFDFGEELSPATAEAAAQAAEEIWQSVRSVTGNADEH
jgi:hydrogenase maturation protease